MEAGRDYGGAAGKAIGAADWLHTNKFDLVKVDIVSAPRDVAFPERGTRLFLQPPQVEQLHLARTDFLGTQKPWPRVSGSHVLWQNWHVESGKDSVFLFLLVAGFYQHILSPLTYQFLQTLTIKSSTTFTLCTLRHIHPHPPTFLSQNVPRRHNPRPRPPLLHPSTAPAASPSPSLFSLSQKTTAISGARRRLGITLAAAVLEAGGHVACIDILPTPSELERSALLSLAKSAAPKPLTCTYYKCDITDEPALAAVIAKIAAGAERVDSVFWGAVACAGIQQKIPALEYPAADFERILRLNVVGTFLTAKIGAQIMRERRVRGSIVMIASMSGQVANRMCRSVAQEWGQYGIRVNTISPGYIRTAMTDELLKAEPEVEKIWMAGALLGRLGAPEDFKAPAVFLLSEGSAFMTEADLRVDGGHCAIQPLWIAGQVMSHPSEHKAILEVYERIEHETGWGTKWRMDDLKEY
ncbi:NAD(P)-binding protein [Mytilinidion resinicola]|uniref:NAD(P)-binding protein n=1 Tax=Mytilinidion resinicola TaxID=574789 RepID=A0A6A6YFR5_9PEZI|nr:NAD(P)-binding protein [Mytilinidion resinicola]KAF2807373.1 NAD(P)-binding protein [Mytilinidion resinicola]